MQSSVLSELLASSGGRDKVVRTLSYASLCASGVARGPLARKLGALSSQLNHFRTVSRLLDDLPMLDCTLAYGLGRQEKDKMLRVLGVASNLVDQLYYPLEHVAWAADSKLVALPSSAPWWTASSICWCLSLYLQLLRSLRMFSNAHTASSQCQSDPQKVAALVSKQREYVLLALQATLDLGHAVHWLPEGFLWAGKVGAWQRGLLGSASSLLGLYLTVRTLPANN